MWYKNRSKKAGFTSNQAALNNLLFIYNSAGMHKKAIAESDEYKSQYLNTIMGFGIYPLGQIN